MQRNRCSGTTLGAFTTVRGRVALLTGCVQDLVFPDINRDTADVALANGFEVETPRARLALSFQHRSKRWTVTALDEGRRAA